MVDNPEAERRRRWRRLEKEVRAVLVAWDPIDGAPDDEYDCLIWPSIKRLDAGVDREALADWLRTELADHFGLESSRAETRDTAQRLLDIWGAYP